MVNANSRSQQIEFDVFPKQDKSEYSYLSNIKEDTGRSSSSVNLVLSSQSVIVLFICILMLLIASFTLGVEKGKLIRSTTEAGQAPAAATAAETASSAVSAAAQAPKETKPAAAMVTAPETAKNAAATAIATAYTKEEVRSGFVIQVASLKGDSAAKVLMEALAKKGIPSFTKTSGKYLTVLAGTFASREEAQGKLKELKKTYTDCYIKKI